MIWVWIAVLAALSVAPLVFFGWRSARIRGRQESAMALHRAQLRELDLDLADGRLIAEEHEAAKLEVQPNGDFSYRVDTNGFQPDELTVQVEGDEITVRGQHKKTN